MSDFPQTGRYASEKQQVGEASKIGLQVNIDKTEVMKIPDQHQQQQQQRLGGSGLRRRYLSDFPQTGRYASEKQQVGRRSIQRR
ncbi:unnamed protein product [Trichobilharzia regenti]|nr:unnamed protein product [Trichobilharzia regenti]